MSFGACSRFQRSPNPRDFGCVKCGRSPELHDDKRPRDFDLERKLSDLAARAGGLMKLDEHGIMVGDDGGLGALADHRALPGGVRKAINSDQEAREELADARNYLLWGIEPIYEKHLAGDHIAADEVARRLQALSHITKAWHALRP